MNPEYRRTADDGRQVVVQREDNGIWLTWVGDEFNEETCVGAAELHGSMIACALGYGHEDYPTWIDEWVDEIRRKNAA